MLIFICLNQYYKQQFQSWLIYQIQKMEQSHSVSPLKKDKPHLSLSETLNIVINHTIQNNKKSFSQQTNPISIRQLNQIRIAEQNLSIPFLSVQNSKLILHQEAEKFLLSISLHAQVAFILLYGKPQSGKSFLANRLFLNQKEGFTVNNTKQKKQLSQVNICKNTIKNDSNIQIILLEWEGPQNSVLLQILLALSSFCIYTLLPIQEIKYNIKQLKPIIQSAYNIDRSLNDKETQEKCLPQLLWIVSGAYYLTPQIKQDDLFKEQPKSIYEVEIQNKLKSDFKQLFKSYNVCNLSKCSQNNPDQLDISQLYINYAFEMIEIRKKIMNSIVVKRINNIAVSCRLAVIFIKMILPNYLIWNSSSVFKCDKLWIQSATKADMIMRERIQMEIIQRLQFIMFYEIHQELHKKKLIQYANQCRKIKVVCPTKFDEFIDKMILKIREEGQIENIPILDEKQVEKRLLSMQAQLKQSYGLNSRNYLLKLTQQKSKLLKQGQKMPIANQLQYIQRIEKFFSKAYQHEFQIMQKKMLIELSKYGEDKLKQIVERNKEINENFLQKL